MTMNQPHRDRIVAKSKERPTKRATLSAFAAAFVVLVTASVLAVPPALAQEENPSSACTENGMNVQCNEFGSIKMDAHRDIRGDPLDVTARIQLHTSYADDGARWVMFSVRNVTDDGPSPVTVGLQRFSTANGDIVTTRVEHAKPSELNLWVDVLDLPVGTAVDLDLLVGATQRGAFSLEALVLAFDRGYAPIRAGSGEDASLFSFTLLGVNEETGPAAGQDPGSLAEGHKLPALGLLAVFGAVAIVLAANFRRKGLR
jgi:hypothetical protein